MSLFKQWVEVAEVADFVRSDRKQVFLEDGTELGLFKAEDGFHAVHGVCTHAMASMLGGALEGYELECPLHGARFDIRTGNVTAPPATRPLRTYAVKVEGGRIFVKA